MKSFCYLKPNEIEELIHLAEGQWIQPILLAYTHTGMRKGELPRLLWGDIDFKRNILWATSRKQSQKVKEKKRPIPINHDCISLHSKIAVEIYRIFILH